MLAHLAYRTAHAMDRGASSDRFVALAWLRAAWGEVRRSAGW